LAAGADTAEASAGDDCCSAAVLAAEEEAEAGAATLAGAAAEAAGEVEVSAALTFFSFLAGAATTTAAATGVLDCCSATVLAGAATEAAGLSFFATRLTAVVAGLAELIVLVPVEMFSMFKRTDLHLCGWFESKFLVESNYLESCDDIFDALLSSISLL
jgi:hypothetical protein